MPGQQGSCPRNVANPNSRNIPIRGLERSCSHRLTIPIAVRTTTAVNPARETLMMRTLRMCRCVLFLMFLAVIPDSANAQGRSNVYVSLGVGTTQLDGGVDWLIMNGPIGIGAEFGVGNLAMLSFNGSYHPLAHRPTRKLDPFATVGFTTLGDLNYDARGVIVGGGVTYWPRIRVGLRLDGFSFLPRRDDIRFENWNYWGLRAGVAFHFG
jgi:hypothetical protein